MIEIKVKAMFFLKDELVPEKTWKNWNEKGFCMTEFFKHKDKGTTLNWLMLYVPRLPLVKVEEVEDPSEGGGTGSGYGRRWLNV